ncbi:LexA family transcriptional regulator [Cupriavidus pampae]|uniref:MarR family transcriptional regulator n=1 Tax=Cupriavidus pampae TaxID=659251 RepID=A0ABN7Z0W6_9BURK|nr:hypothetical protein [Cupriavidus pampae]CAG9177672.1 hypothetical protein LMG32289_03871 [Cupriavidus pampae]
MQTQVAHTSIRTYRDIEKDGTLSQRQRQILAVMKPFPMDYSLQELAQLTKLPINVVSGRVNELREKAGEIERAPARPCTVTGRTIRPVRRIHPQRLLF